MRLFVAVRLPAVALAHAAAAVAAVRDAHPGPRWVPPERWHLTLAFYGSVDDGAVPALTRRLAKALRPVTDLELALDGAGFFRRRAIWLGLVGDVPQLMEAARRVEPPDPEKRPFRPHLTVARLRPETDPAPAVAALSAYAGPAWRAGAVHLVRSHLGPKPWYDDVATWPLAPRP